MFFFIFFIAPRTFHIFGAHYVMESVILRVSNIRTLNFQGYLCPLTVKQDVLIVVVRELTESTSC